MRTDEVELEVWPPCFSGQHFKISSISCVRSIWRRHSHQTGDGSNTIFITITTDRTKITTKKYLTRCCQSYRSYHYKNTLPAKTIITIIASTHTVVAANIMAKFEISDSKATQASLWLTVISTSICILELLHIFYAKGMAVWRCDFSKNRV